MTASVVVPVFGPERFLTALLPALWLNSRHHFELILVDNGTGYAQRHGEHFASPDNLRVVVNDTNLGFAVACNQGAKVATGDVLVFLNVDTEPQSSWLPPLLQALTLPEVGIAGSRLVYPDGRIQHAGIESYHADGNLEFRNIREDLPSREVEGITGACLAITRECWDYTGGFDEGYWNGYDDVDLCLTARSLGYKIRYVAESTVMHHESATGPERWTRVAENVERLQGKWGSEGVR